MVLTSNEFYSCYDMSFFEFNLYERSLERFLDLIFVLRKLDVIFRVGNHQNGDWMMRCVVWVSVAACLDVKAPA